MANISAGASERRIEPASYVLLLTRVQTIITIVLMVLLSDVLMSGAMREAFRFAILDAPLQYPVSRIGLQFPAVAVALILACAAIRFTAQATIAMVAPDLAGENGAAGLIARLLPRALPIAICTCLATPLWWLGVDRNVLGTDADRHVALVMAVVFFAIGIIVAIIPGGPRQGEGFTAKPSFLVRLINSLLPIAIAVIFAGTVLGIWNSGMAAGMLERYQSSGTLRVVAEAFALFVTCVAVRLALAIALDLIVPVLGDSAGSSARLFHGLIPKLGALAVGVVLAWDIYIAYFTTPGAALDPADRKWVWALIAGSIAIGIAAGLSGGRPAPGEQRLGLRWAEGAERLAGLARNWQWILSALFVLALAIAVLFSTVLQVETLQAIGPVAIILLWAFTATMLLFPIAYYSHVTHMPLLLIFILAGVAFAGFNLNDNHELRLASVAAPAPGHPVAGSYYREELELGAWLKDRQDLYQYDHYPVFLVATEGGGIRAAYFTANVLAALQERCPNFAQHTLAISGVSGGSVGAAVFAALAADHAQNLPQADCAVTGRKPGQIVGLARKALSRDLLSPLLGATLFPDALQRILPSPIDRFDRARAIEYAVEDSWRLASAGCKDCDPDRMSDDVAGLYARTTPRRPVPHLFLNTTEVGTGRLVPFGTMHVRTLTTPYLGQAEIDASPTGAQLRLLQELMKDDRVPLSTAALLSARFPYLTPAGRIGTAGHYVDGGYFENSGTWILSGVVQNLIGQQAAYTNAQDPALEKAVHNAVFVTIVIKSEPCTQRRIHGSFDIRCGDRLQTVDPAATWNEIMSPPRALLNSRDERADTAITELTGVTALVEQLQSSGKAATADDGAGCNRTLCAVTLQFYSAPKVEVPLSWLLSRRARTAIDDAVVNMEASDARDPVPTGPDLLLAVQNRNTIQGSYRRVICLLSARRGATGCATATPP